MKKLKTVEKKAYTVAAYLYYALAAIQLIHWRLYGTITLAALGIFFHWIAKEEYLPLSKNIGDET